MENTFEKNWFRILVGVLIIVILLIATNSSKNEITRIENSTDFSEVLKQDNLVLIDVRSKEEYNESHIPRAINIPYDELENKVKYDKDLNIVVYSYNDSRSHLATTVLEKLCYKNIYEGDMSDYKGKLVTE